MFIRQITAAETLPLRLEVLRPGRPPESAIFEGDESSTTTHWGAFTGDGHLGAVATLVRAARPGTTLPAWQVRGMASSPGVRGQGYGSAVLRALLAYVVASQDAHAPVWCNARLTAVHFYQAHGFEIVGEEFEIPGVGPHFVMMLKKTAGPSS